MKKLYILLVFLISGSLVSAQEVITIDFSKENYSPGETVQAEIFLDNVQSDIKSSEIMLISNETEYDLNPNFVKLGPSFYYLYFELSTLTSGKYNFTFRDIIFVQEDATYQEDFNFGFEIEHTNDSVISISPAILDARNLQFNDLFEVSVSNEGYNEVQVSLSSSAEFVELSQEEINLLAGESKFFTVYISEILRESSQIEYVYVDYGSKRYSVPVWSGDYSSSSELDGNLFFEGESILTTLENGDSLTGGYLKVKNSFNFSLENVGVELDESLENIVDLTENSFDIGANEEYKLNLNLNEDGSSLPGIYEGYVHVISGEFEDQIFLSITILEDTTEVLNETANEDEIIIINESIDSELPEETEEVNFELNAFTWTIIFIVFVLLILFLLYNKKKKKKASLPFFEH